MNGQGLALLFASVMAGLAVTASTQTPADPAAPDPRVATSEAYLRCIVRYMANPDPRVRYSVRQALRSMGPQAVAAINEARAVEKDPHVKAFMTRTLTLMKLTRAKQQGQKPKSVFYDIDHVAMVANLNWTQMDKTVPVLVKAHKANRELVQTFKDAGGDRRDPEAMTDLRAEMKTVAATAETELKAFLKPKQVNLLRRYFDPWSNRKNAAGRGPGPDRPERRP